MTMHYTNELIFDLPDSLIDVTQHIFTISKDGPSLFSLIINQDTIDQEETLQSYEAKLLPEMENNLSGFKLLYKGNMNVAKQEAILMTYTFIHEKQSLYQANVMFICDKKPGERQAIQITASSVDSFTDEWKRAFEDILDSVKLRQGPDLIKQ